MQLVNVIKSKVATPLVRRVLRREDLYTVRRRLADRFIRGDGIEVGAYKTPLPVPQCARVKYVEPADLAANFCGGGGVAPDIFADLESLDGIGDASQDFVIANHVLEHVENPLRALASVARVLRPGGIAFIALPDKRVTFDKARAVTPFAHVLRDYREGPENSRSAHYEDWARLVEGIAPEQLGGRVQRMLDTRENIHFHVWDKAAMAELFACATTLPEIPLAVRLCRATGCDVVWILRRYASARPPNLS
jgi:SAM-dependent methyltransferase